MESNLGDKISKCCLLMTGGTIKAIEKDNILAVKKSQTIPMTICSKHQGLSTKAAQKIFQVLKQ